jgi:hypothetical protein
MSENVNPVGTFGYDEFNCFHISDFQVGDCIIVNTSEGKIRGLVNNVSRKNYRISYKTVSGHSDCHINDIVFLSEFERGWLNVN